MRPRHTAILMATYNGGRHLREQMDSILSQTDKDWTLYVHDDGSSDDTRQIIDEYVAACDQVKVLDYAPCGGACANFLSMLQRVEADYYLFSDQDDVWLANKIRLTRQEMACQEERHPGKPVVVHTDLYVTDGQLNILHESFMTLAGIRPEFLTTFDECVIPFVTGCTMMFNAEARRRTVFPADAAVMHDSWVTLCSLRAGGVVSVLRQPLVLYRQHGHNSVGARDVSTITWGYRLHHLKEILSLNRRIYGMLRALGYGSVLKYIRYKRRYRRMVHGRAPR